MTTQELAVGGERSVTYLVSNLFVRFAKIGEEGRISAMNDMWNFFRRPGEPIHIVWARYETVRQRAALERNFTMSVEAQAAQILRVIGTRPMNL